MTRYITLLFISIYSATAQNSEGSKVQYIETSGHAERKIAPNRIHIHIRIDEKENDDLSTQELENQMVQAFNRLKIDTKKQLFVRGVGSDLETYWLKKNQAFITKEYELVLHRPERLSQVFTTLKKLNLSNAYVTKVRHTDIEELRIQNKIEALTKARNKAQRLLKAVHHKIGKVLYILDTDFGRPPAYAMDSAPRALMKSSRPPTPSFRKIHMESRISVRFEIL